LNYHYLLNSIIDIDYCSGNADSFRMLTVFVVKKTQKMNKYRATVCWGGRKERWHSRCRTSSSALRWRLRPYSCSMPSPIRTFRTAGRIDRKPRLSQLFSSFLPFPMNLLVLSNFSHASPLHPTTPHYTLDTPLHPNYPTLHLTSTSKHPIFVLHIFPHPMFVPVCLCAIYSRALGEISAPRLFERKGGAPGKIKRNQGLE